MVTHMSRTPKQRADGLRGRDQQQGDLRDTQGGAFDVGSGREDALPAGLKRERKGPLQPSSGRRDQDGPSSENGKR